MAETANALFRGQGLGYGLLSDGKHFETLVEQGLKMIILPTKPAVDLHGRATCCLCDATDRQRGKAASFKDLPGCGQQGCGRGVSARPRAWWW